MTEDGLFYQSLQQPFTLWSVDLACHNGRLCGQGRGGRHDVRFTAWLRGEQTYNELIECVQHVIVGWYKCGGRAPHTTSPHPSCICWHAYANNYLHISLLEVTFNIDYWLNSIEEQSEMAAPSAGMCMHLAHVPTPNFWRASVSSVPGLSLLPLPCTLSLGFLTCV